MSTQLADRVQRLGKLRIVNTDPDDEPHTIGCIAGWISEDEPEPEPRYLISGCDVETEMWLDTTRRASVLELTHKPTGVRVVGDKDRRLSAGGWYAVYDELDAKVRAHKRGAA